jgi:hypothetical protein
MNTKAFIQRTTQRGLLLKQMNVNNYTIIDLDSDIQLN